MIDYTRHFVGAKRSSLDRGLREYMLMVYNLMGLAVLVTAVTAWAALNFSPLVALVYDVTSDGDIIGYSVLGKILSFTPLGISMAFMFGMSSMTISTARLLFWLYAVTMGISMSGLGLVFTGHSLAKTFFIASSIFGTMSIYGYTTGRDLTSLGSFLLMGLLGLVVVSLVNLFLHSAAIEFAISFIAVGVFVGLTAWDTQKIKAIYYQAGSGPMAQKMALVGAFTLYLDLINLFVHLLRLTGNANRK